MFLGNCKVCAEFADKLYKGVGLREGFKEGADQWALIEGECKKEDGKDVKCGGDIKCFDNEKCEKKTNTSGFSQRSAPAKLDENSGDDEAPGNRLDYSATLEMAYNNLDKMLGKDGMKGLTAETQKLVGQQKNLMESLNNMAPVLESAKSTLDNMNLPDMDKMNAMLTKMNGGGLSGLMAKPGKK